MKKDQLLTRRTLLTGVAALDLVGVLFALVAAVFWGLYVLTSARVGRLVPGQDGLAVAMVIGALTVLPLGAPGAVAGVTDPRLLALALYRTDFPGLVRLAQQRRSDDGEVAWERRAQLVRSLGTAVFRRTAQRADGSLWSVEHGTYRDDEVNRLVADGDYGYHPVPGYNEEVPMTDHGLPGPQRSARTRPSPSSPARSRSAR